MIGLILWLFFLGLLAWGKAAFVIIPVGFIGAGLLGFLFDMLKEMYEERRLEKKMKQEEDKQKKQEERKRLNREKIELMNKSEVKPINWTQHKMDKEVRDDATSAVGEPSPLISKSSLAMQKKSEEYIQSQALTPFLDFLMQRGMTREEAGAAWILLRTTEEMQEIVAWTLENEPDLQQLKEKVAEVCLRRSPR